MNQQQDVLATVIVPVYNGQQYLKDCIDSILAQTHRHFQLILVDDGSTDSSGTICDEYAAQDDRILVVHTPNGGLCHARNTGIDHARGEYLFFVDADDRVEPGYICDLLPAREEDLVYGGYCNILADGAEFIMCHPCEQVSCDEIRRTYLSRQITFVWCACYRLDMIKKYRIRFDEVYHLWEDVAFNLDYLQHCRTVRFTDSVVYRYYQRPNSAINRFHADRLERLRKECSKVESFCQSCDMRTRWYYWSAARNHYAKWMHSTDPLTARRARSAFNRTLQDPYFAESIPYIRKHGSLDEKLESCLMYPGVYALYRPLYRCIVSLSKLKNIAKG